MSYRFLYTYKVIADYPMARYPSRSMVKETEDGIDMLLGINERFIPEEYPKLFKRLPWWDGLTIENYPEYIKINNHIVKVRWTGDTDAMGEIYPVAAHDENQTFAMSMVEPATEHQFLNQKS